jgi:SAM-dependent methyltransferase
MKLRESGMPEECDWETLFDIELILDRLEIDGRLRDVVELGCGYGTFTLPVARRISGVIGTLDIELAMVERTRQRAEAAGLKNVRCQLRDVMKDGFGCDAASQHACLLFNILHCEDPVRLLTVAARAVRPGGWVLVIHWRYDPGTPRGPAMEIRPRPEQIMSWAAPDGGLEVAGEILDLPPWHYGIRLVRRAIAMNSRLILSTNTLGVSPVARREVWRRSGKSPG